MAVEQRSPTGMACEPIEKKINKTVITLQHGDLTALEVDAWVFYAREDLAVGSGYGTAISSRGGVVVSKELGNSFRAGGIATDMPLAADRPVDFGLQDFCSRCQICATACPPGAISREGKTVRRGVSSWHVDTTLCRRYWDSIGSSCSICQIVCPWNHSNTWFHNIIRQEAEKAPYLRRLIINGEKFFYKNRLRPEPEWARTTAIKRE